MGNSPPRSYHDVKYQPLENQVLKINLVMSFVHILPSFSSLKTHSIMHAGMYHVFSDEMERWLHSQTFAAQNTCHVLKSVITY